MRPAPLINNLYFITLSLYLAKYFLISNTSDKANDNIQAERVTVSAVSFITEIPVMRANKYWA